MQLDGWLCPKCQRVWGPLALQCLHCNEGARATPSEEPPAPPPDPLIQRTIIELSAPRSALRARLHAAAEDLGRAGYGPGEIAARLAAGENPDV